jgi:hypothetical protein
MRSDSGNELPLDREVQREARPLGGRRLARRRPGASPERGPFRGAPLPALLGIAVPALLAGAPALAVEDGLPVAVVEQAVIDLGDVAERQEVAATFVVRNKGGAELRILRAAPS